MEITTIGLDLAKSVFQVHGVDKSGAVLVRRALRRAQVLAFFSKLSPCIVGIEACGTSHYWGREIANLGHDVRLMPPAYVKPYVKRGKTDANDAEAICEAVTRPTMRFVAVKSPEQQAALSIHRARNLLVKQRTQLINMIRGLLAEFGFDIPRAIAQGSDQAQSRARHPKKSRGLLREGPSVMFGFIAKHRGIWPLAWMCDALGVSRSGFFAWLTRPQAARAKSDEAIGAKVRESFIRSDRTYGARRVWRDVLEEGFSCGLHRIERLMRIQALKARPRRRRPPPDTGDRSSGAIAPNVLDRRFVATAPNQKWAADFTYIWTAEGWLYVAVVIDLYSRRVVGWSMRATMTAELVGEALTMALYRRGRPAALMHHSDRGSQGRFNRSSQHPD